MKTEPISPEEVGEAKASSIPRSVFEAFNTLIAQNWSGRQAVVRQDDVIELILKLDSERSREEIFAKHFLDIEDLYRAKGWAVWYEKPDYNETGYSYFTFSKK